MLVNDCVGLLKTEFINSVNMNLNSKTLAKTEIFA